MPADSVSNPAATILASHADRRQVQVVTKGRSETIEVLVVEVVELGGADARHRRSVQPSEFAPDRPPRSPP